MVLQCRACLSTKATAFVRMESPLLEGVDFFSCFSVCTQLDANPDDGLPDILCANCSKDLQVAFSFVQNARQADVMLREELSKKLMPAEIMEMESVLKGNDTKIELVEDSETDECVVEELIEQETVMVEDDNEPPLEIMEVQTVEEHIIEDSLDDLGFIEEKLEDYSTTPEEITNGEPEQQQNMEQYIAEDEADDIYLREYKENEESSNTGDAGGKCAKWKCVECKRVLCGDVSYEGHMNMHRMLRPYKCNQCTCTFRCKTTLERHTQLRHINCGPVVETITVGICGKCPKTFPTSKELHEHYELVHPESYPVQCRHCPLVPPLARTKLVEHFRVEHPVEHRKHFPTVGRPINEPIKSTPWQCEVCKRYLRSEAALHDHRHTHQNTRPHECQFCTKRFATTSNLRQHMRGIHPEEYEKLVGVGGDTIVQCEVCKKQLLKRNHEKHMALHMKKEREANDIQTKFLCAYCSRECKNQKSLNQHEKMHQGASPDISYICADCDRSYVTQHLLQQHRKQAHKERDHFCPICGNGFKLKNQLVNHMKLHLEKNIKCPHCDKRYSRKFDLDVHMRSHTGEQPYACHLCEKRFAIKVRLTYHLQKHYGIKHRCRDCGAEFNSRQKLKAHTYKHTGMPYRCEMCDGHGFANRDVFKRHLQRVHGTSMSDEELVVMFQQNTGKSTRIRRVDFLEENVM